MINLLKIGRIGELKVQSKLLELNFSVYNNVCDDNGIDLIIEKDNYYFKVQVKSATVLRKQYSRLSFGLGKTNNKPDFFICEYKNTFWIIPSKEIGESKAFTIPLKGKRSKFDKYRNNWAYLMRGENLWTLIAYQI